MLRPGHAASYDQLLDIETTEQLRYLMRGETDPWMFHQANLRDLGGGHSLLTAFLDGVLSKYAARSTLPIVSPTMDELARKVKARMAFDASGVSASLEPGGKLTVQVTHAATVPVTGLCTPGGETYAGQQISYLALADGQSVTLSLADCNADFVPPPPSAADSLPPGPTVGGNCPPGTGTGGSGGADGTGGAGGSAGNGGAGGDTTMGSLSTDASTDPGPYGGASGCGCAVSQRAPGRGAAALLIALVSAALVRRRRRGAGQASCAMRPSFAGRSMR
jgi:MYXO-CTERM domain-containing protein